MCHSYHSRTSRAFLDDLAVVVDEVDLKACSSPVDSSIV